MANGGKSTGRKVRGAAERATPLDGFVRRLEVLGATPEEIVAVRSSWDDLDEDWTEADRYAFAHAPDPVIRAQLEALRAEHFEHTHDEVEQEALVAAAEYRELKLEAEVAVQQSVRGVLAWVGDSMTRATAMLAVELDSQNRKGVVGPLREMLAAGASSV